MERIAIVLVTGIAGAAGAQVVVWDYGLSAAVASGGNYAGCWASESHTQNFTDNATFELTTTISGMTYDSCQHGLEGRSFQIKVESDSDGDGVPDTTEAVFSAQAVSETFLGTFDDMDVYRYGFSFEPIIQPGGAVWYWGVAGDTFDAGQVSHSGSELSLANGRMHQYEGIAYESEPSIGDQAFQLISVPAPSAAAVLAVGGLVAARRRR